MAETDNSSWQTRLSTVRERVEYAFNKSIFTDVEFTVDDCNGGKVGLSANKYILAASSSVFEAMFYGELAEKGPAIDLPDCTKDGLQEMLRFVHSDVVNLTGNNVMEVLYLAKKYMLPFLETRCFEYISNDLTPEDVFTVLSQAQQSSNTRVEELCWDIVDLKTHQAVTSKAFLNISHDLLKQVLERETLQTDEVNLFNAVDSWASNQIEEESKKQDGEAKRAVLGDDIIRLIRFPVMSQKQFAENVLVSNVLGANEVTEVVQVFNSIDPSQSSFQCVKRQGQWCEKWTENRFDAVDTRYSGESNTHHSILFEVNKPIFLAGVRLFGIHGEAKGLKIKLSISKWKSETELFQKDVFLEFKQNIDGSYFGHSVMINPNVLLLSKERYTIEATTIDIAKQTRKSKGQTAFGSPISSNSDCYRGSGGKSVIECGDIKITFTNSGESNPGSTVEYGQFPSFLLRRKVLLNKKLLAEPDTATQGLCPVFSKLDSESSGQSTGLFGSSDTAAQGTSPFSFGTPASTGIVFGSLAN